MRRGPKSRELPVEEPLRLGRLQAGPDREMEEQADELLAADRRRTGCKFDILSTDQLKIRFEHEVYSTSGRPVDPANSSGLYKRAWSSRTINDRPTGRNFSRRADPWLQYHHEFSGDEVAGAYLPNVTREEVTAGMNYVPGLRRDPRWAVDQGVYHHLDRYQRCRIRAALRVDDDGYLVERLAKHYGVPVAAIERIRNSCRPRMVES